MVPQTHYTKSGDVNIAYQVVGQGPGPRVHPRLGVEHRDLLGRAGIRSLPDALSSSARLILFDKRGTGLSDRVAEMPNLEVRMDDVRAVLDTVGSQRTALFGSSEGGVMCMLFAATYPDRTSVLMMHGAYARLMSAPDYPWGFSAKERSAFIDQAVRE